MANVKILRSEFGSTKDGRNVTRFDLVAPDGAVVSVLDYGAVVLEVHVPDRKGVLTNVALGHPTLAGYETNAPYFGAFVGRTAGRTAGKPFELDGREVRLHPNERGVHLHGGPGGFHRKLFDADTEVGPDGEALVVLSRTSPDGEDGYPGNLDVEVRVGWSEDHVLRIEADAYGDAPTPASFTHHGAWNLAGEGAGNVAMHTLQVEADAFLALGSDLVATGHVLPVQGTPLDLRKGPLLESVFPVAGRFLHSSAPLEVLEMLGHFGGLDHAFVTTPAAPGVMRDVAVLRDPASGRRLTLSTSEPILQIFTSNGFDGSLLGRSGRPLLQHGGVALEPERWPNAVHRPEWPSALVTPGAPYHFRTAYRFDVT